MDKSASGAANLELLALGALFAVLRQSKCNQRVSKALF